MPRPATYYLWYPDGVDMSPIQVGTELEKEATLVRLNSGGLAAGLQELRTKSRSAPGRYLEIHCHGEAGTLHLGGVRTVNHTNVEWFGQQLRGVLESGGLIEILACSVAMQKSTSGAGILNTPPVNIVGFEYQYHGKLQSLMRTSTWDPDWVDDPTVHFYKVSNGAQPIARRPAIPYVNNAHFVPDPERDGLSFCRRLAVSSGMKVRAALLVQHEEGYEGGLFPVVSLVGHWEGPVFDFYPDNSVQFYGMAPLRPASLGPIRTDLILPSASPA
jgi:hypothetical protein